MQRGSAGGHSSFRNHLLRNIASSFRLSAVEPVAAGECKARVPGRLDARDQRRRAVEHGDSCWLQELARVLRLLHRDGNDLGGSAACPLARAVDAECTVPPVSSAPLTHHAFTPSPCMQRRVSH